MINLTYFLILLFLIFGLYFLFKFIHIYHKIKLYSPTKVLCTDSIIRRTYNRKYYIFIYHVKLKKEEFNLRDQTLLPFYPKLIKINQNYLMYIDLNNPDNVVTPLEVLSYKYYLLIGLILLIIIFIL